MLKPRFYLIMLLLAAVCPVASAQPDVTVRINHNGKSYDGKPLVRDSRNMLLLRSDGRLTLLPATSLADFTRVSDTFQPLTARELRKQLQREFGSKYEVSALQNFVVVHPSGQASQWAQPFESLYHRFHHYFASRQFSLNRPQFPMVAVVLKSRHEFDRFLKSYHQYDEHVRGYYNPRSNRIITYDQSAGRSDPDWLFNTSTIIHEATHQSAFNTGVHSRLGPVPRWMSEGLALMFEARGVNNCVDYPRLADRINPDRLAALKRFYREPGIAGQLSELIAGDQLFRQQPALAYSLSWGLTFFLAENYPDRYFRLLQEDAKRDSFTSFPPSARLQAFTRVLGSELHDLEARLEKFIHQLPDPGLRHP